MEHKPFLSVVMPVYGVEKYLEGAVGGVLAQTYQDFEVILVDDCSPDKSGEICDALASKDGRIRVLHLPENGGLSNARNQGLKLAQGAYICFLDSDDEFDPDLFQCVVSSLQKNAAKVVVYGLVEEYYNAKGELSLTQKVSCKETLIQDQDLLRKEVIDLEEKTLYGYAWNKFYDLQYLRKLHLEFENVTLIEDIAFNVNYFMDIDSMNLLDITPYHYKKRMENSLTSKFVPAYFELHEKRIQMILDQYKYWGLCTAEVKGRLANLYARYIFSALQRNCDRRSGMDGKARKQWVHDLFASPLFQELMPYATTSGGALGIMVSALKKERSCLCRAGGRFIYMIKNKLPILFAKLK